MLRKPPPLNKGDRVAIVSPSSPHDAENLERGLAWLADNGFEPVVGQHARKQHRYLAGTDAERAADFQWAVTDPDVAGVVCARGGYGAARLLPLLDVGAIRPHCKFVVGFSDITAIHMWLLGECSWVTFHGPMVGTQWAGEGFDPVTSHSLLEAMQGRPAAVRADRPRVVHEGTARGRLVGGNLALLTTTIGTRFEPDTDGAILLLEDVYEAPYRVDRMLTHLRQAGKLTGVRAIVVGEMLHCAPPPQSDYTVEDVIADCLSDLAIPVILNFPISHGKPNHTVALGIEHEIDTTKGTLTPLEPAFEG